MYERNVNYRKQATLLCIPTCVESSGVPGSSYRVRGACLGEESGESLPGVALLLRQFLPHSLIVTSRGAEDL